MSSWLPYAGLAAAVGMLASGAPAEKQQSASSSPWARCCGMSPWPQNSSAGSAMGQGMMGGSGVTGHGMMEGGMMGCSMARHHAAMIGGLPAAYANLRNPLPQTPATVERGAKVYAANCASCHGETGLGDGPASRDLNPKPANLAWLSRMPMSRWDPFMYWTVAEGGAPFGTAMPSFKSSLPKDDIWAAIAYVQARLPRSAPAK